MEEAMSCGWEGRSNTMGRGKDTVGEGEGEGEKGEGATQRKEEGDKVGAMQKRVTSRDVSVTHHIWLIRTRGTRLSVFCSEAR